TLLPGPNTAAASASVEHTVNLKPAALTIAASPTPSTWGQPVTFTITGTTGAAPLSNYAVELSVDGIGAIGVFLEGAGVGTFTTSTLEVGTHTITATLLPGPNTAAASASVEHTVNLKSAALTIAASPTPSDRRRTRTIPS